MLNKLVRLKAKTARGRAFIAGGGEIWKIIVVERDYIKLRSVKSSIWDLILEVGKPIESRYEDKDFILEIME